VLAKPAMILKFQKPAYPLNQFVELFTYYEARSEAHSIERLLPDGSVNIIIDLTETTKHIFDNNTLAEKQSFKKAWVSGMHSSFISISAAKEASMFVIRFLPGGSFPFLRLPLNQITNQVIDAELIFGQRIHFLREQLGMATVSEKFSIVSNWLNSVAGYSTGKESIVSYAIKEIDKSPAILSLTDIAKKSGYSQKQFIHIFKTHLGITPKMYQRIVRFNKVLSEIEKTQTIHWTKLCYDLDYHDQAHFIKDFQQFAGLNPNHFLKERGEYIHYVPIA
jgi:AraC-like DNA-binding protein